MGGQATRAAYDHRSYMRRRTIQRSPFYCFHSLDIPIPIIEMARRPFRTRYGVEIPSLRIWEPPYIFEKPQECRKDELKEEEWREMLNFQQFENIIEAGRERAIQVEEESGEIVAEGMQKEIAERIRAWEEMKKDDDGSVEATVALEWSAKIICVLVMDKEVMQRGKDDYKWAQREGLLPWMRIPYSHVLVDAD
ncbi:hypothetical protein A0H81_11114 [Grifola frondosa]|uniref:Uncharacterized protein n=1 Tax=Grifola frondosa TaxID=5627 RepID=A0A1C7LWX2_GRIFR|nr:hypothetical protein A0H81_11114 [Grifola frondosa]